jgi:hypothetical protein
MIAAVSPEVAASLEPAAEPTHWLRGRYFVPLPDLSDETRQAINKGRATAVWLEIIARLRDLERRGQDDQARRAAVSGRIEGLGVNGLAAAVGCSHTTALKHLRHLESLGLIRTEQAEFTVEADPATGKIRRNYAKAPPKVIVVTVEDRHCRPCRASATRRGDTPGTSPRATGDTPETGGKADHPQARNWRVSKDGNLHRGSHPLDGNKRRTAAGPLGRPAAAAAKAQRGQRQEPPAKGATEPGSVDPAGEWQRKADQEARDRNRQELAQFIAPHLGMAVIEVIGLWSAAPDDLKSRCIAAGILTPEGKFTERLKQRPARTGTTCQKSDNPAAGFSRFVEAAESIVTIRERAEESGDQSEASLAKRESIRIIRNYAKAELETAVA